MSQFISYRAISADELQVGDLFPEHEGGVQEVIGVDHREGVTYARVRASSGITIRCAWDSDYELHIEY